MQKICDNCAQKFNCGSTENKCWCFKFPNLIEIEDGKDCLCENCLRQKVIQHIDVICNNISIEGALENNWIKKLPKQDEMLEGIDYTIDNGFYVFTKWFHLKRGYCCKNACRNCAYGYKK